MKLVEAQVPEPRIVGLDIENYPLWYGGGDFVYDRVVCVSWKWVGHEGIYTKWLDWRRPDATLLRELAPLREAIENATHLLGHNFQHDEKGLRATFNDLGQSFLPSRPILDTMRCLPSGIPRSLEYLVERLGTGQKPHVSPHTWISAVDRAKAWAIDEVIERNREDVLLTEALYWKEKELGWI